MKRRTFRNLRADSRRAPRAPAAETPAPSDHHSVYVIELDPAVAKLRKVKRENPRAVPGKPCVYVGMTGLTVEERFANHRAGVKSAYVVKRFGRCLLPALFAHLNPMPFDAAVAMERDLAEDLRAQGYTVTGGH